MSGLFFAKTGNIKRPFRYTLHAWYILLRWRGVVRDEKRAVEFLQQAINQMY